jgi:integrase
MRRCLLSRLQLACGLVNTWRSPGQILIFEHGAVSISETIEWRGREWLFEDTKRERSRRVVKLQNWVTALLGRLKKKASLADMRPGDFVFKSHRGGPIREPKLVGRHFKPLLELAGLPNIRL